MEEIIPESETLVDRLNLRYEMNNGEFRLFSIDNFVPRINQEASIEILNLRRELAEYKRLVDVWSESKLTKDAFNLIGFHNGSN